MITNPSSRILHYLRGSGGGPLGSRVVLSDEERPARQQARYDHCKAIRHSVFAKTDVAMDSLLSVPDRTTAWALDRSVATAKMATRRRCHLIDEVAKISMEWFLSDRSANAGRGMAPPRLQRLHRHWPRRPSASHSGRWSGSFAIGR